MIHVASLVGSRIRSDEKDAEDGCGIGDEISEPGEERVASGREAITGRSVSACGAAKVGEPSPGGGRLEGERLEGELSLRQWQETRLAARRNDVLHSQVSDEVSVVLGTVHVVAHEHE